MKKICIAFFSLVVAFGIVPVLAEAQTDADEQAALAEIAEQLKGIEQEVNYLALLVQKVALERQAEDLRQQLAIALASQETIAEVPAEDQNVEIPEIAVGEEQSLPEFDEVAMEEEQVEGPAEDLFAQIDIDEDEESLVSPKDDEDEKESIFAAALGSIKNMGTPQLAALTILGILAVFVLVRRLRGRKQGSVGNAPVSSQGGGPSSQTLSQPQQDLLQEGRQELKENVVWK